MEDFMCNLLIMGKTGTGKSTLLNYICDTNLAQTGTGKPVTGEGIYDYLVKINDQDVRIYDSWGIEAGKVDRWKQLIKDSLESHGTTKSIKDWFHSIIYCVQAGGGRVEDIDEQIIRLFLNEGYKLTIVLTKADQVNESTMEAMKKTIASSIWGDSGISTSNLNIIATCAEKKVTRSGETKPFGKEEVCKAVLDNWRDTVMERIPKHIVGRICEHIKTGMEAIKDQYRYMDKSSWQTICTTVAPTWKDERDLLSGIPEENVNIYNNVQKRIQELVDDTNTRIIPDILKEAAENCHKANMTLCAMMNVKPNHLPLETPEEDEHSSWPTIIGTVLLSFINIAAGLYVLLGKRLIHHIRSCNKSNIEEERMRLFDYIDKATEDLIAQYQAQEPEIAEQIKKAL